MENVLAGVRGTPCAYALELCGDHVHAQYYYVGITSDIQTRIAQHQGAIPGGAKWTQKHIAKICEIRKTRGGRGRAGVPLNHSISGLQAPPVDILSLLSCLEGTVADI